MDDLVCIQRGTCEVTERACNCDDDDDEKYDDDEYDEHAYEYDEYDK